MLADNITDANPKTCKDCGTVLGPGREDKQYCSEACRTNFNNRKRREAQNKPSTGAEQVTVKSTDAELSIPEYITRIQDILWKNRKILEGLCDEEKPGRIKMRDLIGKGFNTKFFTSEAEPTGTGHIYRFCFEYGYREEDNGVVVIICRKREVS